MRKKTIYVLATVMCMSIFTACGSTNRADAGNEVQQEVQAEDNMQKEQQAGAEGNAETELQTEAVPENTAEAVTGEEKTLNRCPSALISSMSARTARSTVRS